MNDLASTLSHVRVIVLLPGVAEREFEKFMKTDVFPATQVLRRNVSNTKHSLVKSDAKVNGHHCYLWLSQAEIVGGGTEIIAPPVPDRLSEKMAEHGTVLTFLGHSE